MPAREVNFDSIVGPTHNYAGLAFGNIASQRHRNSVSNPRQAALEGLAKMKRLADMGVRQAVLPPQERPDISMLRRLGYCGSDANVLDSVQSEDPALLAACCSASAMWAANAATVSPSADTGDHRTHFTAANLVSQFHRSLETQTTAAILRVIFPDEKHFVHHPSLPACAPLGDEGAANHTRLCSSYGEPGLELFVYGRAAEDSASGPQKFPARQSLAASQSIARLHQLEPVRTLFVQQNPAAIDAGVFHNDVICVGNQNVLMLHEQAFANGPAALSQIAEAFLKTTGRPLCVVQVSANELSLSDAVNTYLFNSQLVTAADKSEMTLIAPIEAKENDAAWTCIDRIIADEANPIASVIWADVRQSMKNGGGPACLRLRVVLNEDEMAAAHSGIFLTDALYIELTRWVTRHYRERLAPDDLADPNLLHESRTALDELTQILGIGLIYRFQRSTHK